MHVNVRHATVQQRAHTARRVWGPRQELCTSKLIVPYNVSDVTAGRSRTWSGSAVSSSQSQEPISCINTDEAIFCVHTLSSNSSSSPAMEYVRPVAKHSRRAGHAQQP